ncbi:hypothetical protein LEP1GSC008_1543 [Leptospira kirschneri serovar Bulgarica str. Nikolaevo]|uniref:Uncharacterized protein n=1 Tax=Leptospira kirschneri serovar Bulgarica str. Nikolaevo TaxID=1240687 RepID=M6FEV6_9LEPT|nr:hypothetical protein LEP1GSC008_1543 [Leptospira kirschneri serovar Bulgarica str. Nikolaevo]
MKPFIAIGAAVAANFFLLLKRKWIETLQSLVTLNVSEDFFLLLKRKWIETFDDGEDIDVY